MTTNENGRVTEVAATVSVDDEGAIRATDNRESISAVTVRAMGHFTHYLGDHADDETLVRHREAGEADLCCARCGVVLANEARCWNCGREVAA